MTITVNVRLNAGLAQTVGTPRLRMVLPEGASVGDLLDQLAVEQPILANRITHLIVAVAGRHVGEAESLADEQEVLLVIPAAGG